MNGRPRVLITNGEERSMLAAARSLHEGGYEVTTAAFTRRAPGFWSRACSHRLLLTGAREDADCFVEQLARELRRRSYATLLPGSDAALLVISGSRARLAEFTELGLPAPAVVERALSRESLVDAAEVAGMVGTPSVHCTGTDEALVAAARLGYPVVLKSTEAADLDGGVVRGVPKGQIATDEADLKRRVPAFRDGLLAQRFMGEKILSVGGVMAGGALLAACVSRYRRTWPPDAGSVTFSETVLPPPGLEDMTTRLLATIGWEGIFEVELIHVGPEEFSPIDLNARPYGSMALARAAGAPLARIWCDWLLRRRPQTARARPGVRYRWEDGEVRYIGWQLQHGHLLAALGPLIPHRGVTHAFFELADPLPLVACGPLLGGAYLQKILRERHGANERTRTA